MANHLGNHAYPVLPVGKLSPVCGMINKFDTYMDSERTPKVPWRGHPSGGAYRTPRDAPRISAFRGGNRRDLFGIYRHARGLR